jgi:predicted Zn-dependent protease
MKKFDDLPDEEKEQYYELVVEILGEGLYCDRVWSAWSYNTMTENDFYLLSDDDGYVHEKAELIYNFMGTMIEQKVNSEMRKNKIKNFLDRTLNK